MLFLAALGRRRRALGPAVIGEIDPAETAHARNRRLALIQRDEVAADHSAILAAAHDRAPAIRVGSRRIERRAANHAGQNCKNEAHAKTPDEYESIYPIEALSFRE